MNGPGGSGSAAARAGAGTAVFCRDPVRRSLVERVIPSAAIHASAMETTLAAVRMRASAVVLDIGGVEGREADLIRSLRRARPDARIYLLVPPHAEPVARDLLKVGATDYLLTPDAIHDLPAMLSQEAAKARPGRRGRGGNGTGRDRPDATAPQQADWKALFDASCGLATLAARDSHTILAEGLQILARATAAAGGAIALLNRDTGRLCVGARVATAGEPNGDLSDGERSAVEFAVRANATTVVRAEGHDAPEGPGMLIAMPLRGANGPFGALSLVCREEPLASRAVYEALERLVASLGQMYGAAREREARAGGSPPDAANGLMNAETFLRHMDALVAEAAGQRAEVAVVVLEPARNGSGEAPSAKALTPLTSVIAAEQRRGRQGGRLGPNRFAIAWSRRPGADETPSATDFIYRTWMEELSDQASGADASPRLRMGLAVFPQDGRDAATLLAAAEDRLSASA